ncbi:MAG: 16S rRNA (cytosine(1402)-N(4))-methyltransferase RsmH [Burkholderiaceae bacterium]
MTDSVPGSIHRTVLLSEAVAQLITDPQGVYVDGTFGRGGHSRLLLSQLGPQAKLIALDRDLDAVAAAADIQDKRFQILHTPFSELSQELGKIGVVKLDGLLLDLGISSPQIDTPARGFSFRFDAPLDMRMDTTRGITAADWLASADQAEITEVISGYGEERFAARIAAAIVGGRQEQPIASTGQLAALVARVVRTREGAQDPATRTFQALRIFINRELEELKAVMAQAIHLVKPGGRIAVISFHSLEDRLVKQLLAPPKLDVRLRNLPLRGDLVAAGPWKPLAKIKPSAEEVRANPRARSAVLRVAQRNVDAGAQAGVHA